MYGEYFAARQSYTCCGIGSALRSNAFTFRFLVYRLEGPASNVESVEIPGFPCSVCVERYFAIPFAGDVSFFYDN